MSSPNPNPVFQLQFFADAEVTRAEEPKEEEDPQEDS